MIVTYYLMNALLEGMQLNVLNIVSTYKMLFLYCLYKCFHTKPLFSDFFPPTLLFDIHSWDNKLSAAQSSHCSLRAQGNVTYTCPIAKNWLSDWTLLSLPFKESRAGSFPIIAACKTGSSGENHRQRDVFSVTTHSCISWFGASQWGAGWLCGYSAGWSAM